MVQLMLPKIVRMARSQQRGLVPFEDAVSRVVAAMWEQIMCEPLPSATLRALIGDRGRYQRAINELQRHLLVTTAGVHEAGSGWPAALIALTCDQFDVGGGTDHAGVAAQFLDTMLETTPGELGRAFRWPATQARACLDELVDAGRATYDGTRYYPPSR
ncbi:hypothetical protein E1218_06920 [Kribbella turkmenica]|uniref:Uncharacterized protein n=1 Tax=Kribbella turkmenica TaxID=2530375 RepID=A0A4R4XD44_9ACTN|nr:hypothetical protein [Kribbella turkmenica]TDD28545.1 hypothetical protein E1218_06920 [Kribbella turkmenica]